MKKCDKCHNKFTYSEILKSIFNCYENIICKKCKAQYKASFPSIVIISILVILPLVLQLISIFVIKDKTHLIYFAIYEICIVLLSPFLVVYKQV